MSSVQKPGAVKNSPSRVQRRARRPVSSVNSRRAVRAGGSPVSRVPAGISQISPPAATRNWRRSTTSPFAWTGTTATAPGWSTMLSVAVRPLGRRMTRSWRARIRPRNTSRSRRSVDFTRASLLVLRGAPVEKVLEERGDLLLVRGGDRGAGLAGHLPDDRAPAPGRNVGAERLVQRVALGAAPLREGERRALIRGIGLDLLPDRPAVRAKGLVDEAPGGASGGEQPRQEDGATGHGSVLGHDPEVEDERRFEIGGIPVFDGSLDLEAGARGIDEARRDPHDGVRIVRRQRILDGVRTARTQEDILDPQVVV